MDHQQLLNFQKVAELNNMSRAAEELHISQPAISKSIANLEKELSLSLFDRKGRQIALNAEGMKILEHVNNILAEFDEIHRFVMQKHELKTVHILAKAADQLLPKFVFEFNKNNPDINIQVAHYHAQQTPDIIVTSSLQEYDGTNGLTVVKEDFTLIAPATHPLAKAKSVSLADLKNEPMVFLSEGIPLRDIMIYWLKEAGVKPSFLYECDSCVMMREIINSGKGVGMVPSKTWSFPVNDDIAIIPIVDKNGYRFVNVECKSNTDSVAVTKVYRHLVSFLEKYNEVGYI